MEALLRAKGLWKCTQVLSQDFMTTLGTLTLNEKEEIQTKFDKELETIQCFLDPNCKEIARGSLTAKAVWKTLKDHLEGQHLRQRRKQVMLAPNSLKPIHSGARLTIKAPMPCHPF